MKKPKRRRVRVLVTLSVHPGMTAAEARRELRTRVNDLSEHHSWLASGRQPEESDVRVVRLEPIRGEGRAR